MLVLGLWFVFQLWSGSASFEHPEEGGGVAFFAHIGGFVFGMLTVQRVRDATPAATVGSDDASRSTSRRRSTRCRRSSRRRS